MPAAAGSLRASLERPQTVGFARLAWGTLLYTIFVILFGAVVRITGSGAGCGQHWPSCQGETLHLPRSVETAIELTHRLTSGLALVAVVALLIQAFRAFPKDHRVRRGAVLSVVFMLTEALIGAGLVLLSLVGENDSVQRAGVMAAHLVNTSLLTAALAGTAWCASNAGPASFRPRGLGAGLVLGMLGVLVVSTTGAITALGDTLYPVAQGASLDARMGGAHFLERLRSVHPIVSVLVAAGLLWLSARVHKRSRSAETQRWARALKALVLVQVGAGLVNVMLSAPGWMQVLHLLLATLLWIALILTFTSHQAEERFA